MKVLFLWLMLTMTFAYSIPALAGCGSCSRPAVSYCSAGSSCACTDPYCYSADRTCISAGQCCQAFGNVGDPDF